jgi:Putative peptidoglycan binding domain
MEDILDQLIHSHMKIVREYCKLAVRPSLSEPEADRMSQILDLAQSDGLLDFLINEADHFLAHDLSLLNEEVIQGQKANLKKKMKSLLHHIEPQASDNLSEWKGFSQELQTVWVQQQLRKKGFYEGEIDGVYGMKTKAAAELFCQVHNFDPTEVELQETIDALLSQNVWIQQQLKNKGFDTGPIDGIYGPQTQAAVAAFCKAKNLDIDEVEIQSTLNALLC